MSLWNECNGVTVKGYSIFVFLHKKICASAQSCKIGEIYLKFQSFLKVEAIYLCKADTARDSSQVIRGKEGSQR